eukprot:6183377-Pleurochrysis_carterae.AAC.7
MALQAGKLSAPTRLRIHTLGAHASESPRREMSRCASCVSTCSSLCARDVWQLRVHSMEILGLSCKTKCLRSCSCSFSTAPALLEGRICACAVRDAAHRRALAGWRRALSAGRCGCCEIARRWAARQCNHPLKFFAREHASLL